MGIHIRLQTQNGQRHSDWDSIRHVGDNVVCDLIEKLDTISVVTKYEDDEESQMNDLPCLHRPSNFSAWRSALPLNRHNPDRIPYLLDILEENPDYWIYISY